MARLYSTLEKKEYAKKFSKRQVVSYRKGKKYGFLCGVHAKKR